MFYRLKRDLEMMKHVSHCLSGSSEDETKVVKKEKKTDLRNPLIQRSKNRGRAKEEEHHSSSEDSDENLRWLILHTYY